MAAKPRFTVPQGAVARVRIIDSTTRLINLPAKTLVTPSVPGFELLPETPTWCFLIESPSGGKAIFDLGVPPNWRDKFPPTIVDLINRGGWITEADRHVADILRDDGISPLSINAIVWSHWHGDHQGDLSTFPSSTDLIVGPGFKEAFLPGYPAKENSPVSESDFVNRIVHEITFPSTPNALHIGSFRAYDFFSDGSFYLLDTPGHAVGHLAGLARTTPDTFVLMGGDICHHNGELRPSEHLPLPAEVRLPAFAHPQGQGSFYSGAELESIQTKRSRAPNQPFFDPNVGVDIPLAIRTLKEVQAPDAEDNVLFICAHDYTIKGIVDFFPAEANDWKAKGWREKTYWKFLGDFQGALEGGKS